MLYRAHLQLFLVILVAVANVAAQSSSDSTPLSKSEVLAALETSKGSEELIKKTNAELIAAIAARGVDFVLTPEEEWQMEMRDASDDLLEAIRNAVDPKEREQRINIDRQQRLYTTFATNFNSNDYAGKSSALTAAREFVGLYANDASVAEIVTFMQRNMLRLEQTVNMMQQREVAMERARAQALEARQRMEQQRDEQQRRRDESAARNADNQNTNRTGIAAGGSSQRQNQNSKEAPQYPQPRQPSDPVPPPRAKWPTDRRP